MADARLLERKIAKQCPKCRTSQPSYPPTVVLRVHCLQLFFELSDPVRDDALYEIESMRRFAGLRRSARLPDKTTTLKQICRGDNWLQQGWLSRYGEKRKSPAPVAGIHEFSERNELHADVG
jgi:hypothetical protein